jgi:hypothetical protein
MSFILDALRKSENARHREVTPALAEIRVVRRESRMPWVLAVLGVLLLINALVLLALYLRREPAVPVAVAPPAAAAPVAGNRADGVRRPGPARPGVRSLADEAAAGAPPPYVEPPPLRSAPANRPYVADGSDGSASNSAVFGGASVAGWGAAAASSSNSTSTIRSNRNSRTPSASRHHPSR